MPQSSDDPRPVHPAETDAAARAAAVAAYYDEYTADYLECSEIIQYGRFASDDDEHMRILAERAGVEDGQHVLDAGCGVGAVMLHLARRFPNARFDGVTLSREQVRLASERFQAAGLAQRCVARQDNFENLSSADATHDLVLFCETLGYADAEASLREAFRVVKPGGAVYVKEILAEERPFSAEEREELDQFHTSWLYGTHTPSEVQAIATSCGFTIEWFDPSYTDSHEMAIRYRATRLRQRHPLIRGFPPITHGDYLLRKPAAS
ncbi:MAG: methyltransferase domain-containing protein [Acidobacteriota bacterium]